MKSMLNFFRCRIARQRVQDEGYSRLRIEQAAAEIGAWLYRAKYTAKFGSERAYCQKMADIYKKRLEWYMKNF